MPARLLFSSCLLALGLVWCSLEPYQSTAADKPKPKKNEESAPKDFDTKLNTRLIGDYTTFAGLAPIAIEGVGLVTRLAGTGGNPAPSQYRTALLEEMKRRDVKDPNKLLASPNTALVVVRAYLPPLMKPGETLDVEVVIPPGANATSLSGGWLLTTDLHEHAFIPGKGTLQGHPYARAQGPILVQGTGAESARSANLLLRGRILGGATVRKERELAIYLRNDFRSVRNSSRIADSIGQRFHHFDQFGSQKPMGKALTDQKITLDVHPRYKDNFARYLQVIRHIAFEEKSVAQRVRMQRLHEELMQPETADEAALQLEAIGRDAIPILQAGLKAPTLECRFHSAVALAYLENADGLPVLIEAAEKERAFRVFAYAAMSTLEDAQVHIALRELMSQNLAETRYGAFRTLWTLDKNDPFIRGEPMGLTEEEIDALKKQEKKSRPLGLWKLHALDTSGEPMVHCTMRERPEVVVFGREQTVSTPLVLSAGRHILLTAQPGDETVSIVRFEPDQPEQRRQVSLRLVDMTRAANDLGASYPEIVQMLNQAQKQQNLAGELEIDALPGSGRVYIRPTETGAPGTKTQVGREHMAPNLFPQNPGESSNEDGAADKGGAMANIKEKSPTTDDDDDEKSRPFWQFWSRDKKTDDR